MEIERFCGEEDRMGCARDEMGTPWKDDWLSRRGILGFEREEVRVVAMVAIEDSENCLEGF